MIINFIFRGVYDTHHPVPAPLWAFPARASLPPPPFPAAFGQQVAANDQTRTLETVTVTDERLTISLLPEKLLDTAPRP